MKRRNFIKVGGAGMLASMLPHPLVAAGRSTPRLNVLFIAIDDLRPELGCFGHPMIKSPNIDRLATDSTMFTRAYCQEAICAPSRMSLLSGLRPDSIGVYGLKTPLRKALPNVLSLPQHFKQNGYTTITMGKIYHHGNDDRQGWTEIVKTGGKQYCDKANIAYQAKRAAEAKAQGLTGLARYYHMRGPASEAADVADNAYNDGAMTDTALKYLERFAASKEPFFLATGIKKPHLPFNAPKTYWDLYDRDAIPLPDRTQPRGAPSLAFTNWGELRSYSDIPKKGDLDDARTRELIHGYYACVSYADAQVGRLLDALDRLGLRKNTAIILWGDHGWKLGDYGDWCKHTNFEYDTHAPLLISLPGQPRGKRCNQPVEFVDVFPTLAETCSLPIPAHCEGRSLNPLLADPDAAWKDIAVSQYPRGRTMGYTLRYKQWRYTEWVDRKTHTVTARELYDHTTGPQAITNLADAPEQTERVAALSKKLHPFIRCR